MEDHLRDDVGADQPGPFHLHEQTLVLNQQWTAVCTTTVRKAMILLCRDTAVAICPATYETFDLDAWMRRSREQPPPRERTIRTTREAIEKPEVILLRTYNGIPRREVSFSRRNLYRRDGYSCQYCGKRKSPQDLSIDHVVPRSRGGKTTWENCVLACVRCNAKKANKTLVESGFQLLRRPERPTWSPLLESLPRAQPPSWQKFISRVEGLAS
jgi:5-methylcytosine-specific restriction endonuclease McrA